MTLSLNLVNIQLGTQYTVTVSLSSIATLQPCGSGFSICTFYKYESIDQNKMFSIFLPTTAHVFSVINSMLKFISLGNCCQSLQLVQCTWIGKYQSVTVQSYLQPSLFSIQLYVHQFMFGKRTVLVSNEERQHIIRRDQQNMVNLSTD